MKIEFLGTAGGFPSLYKSHSQHSQAIHRTGPAIYIHDLQLLIDTSEGYILSITPFRNL
ncbi:hypothetical protein ACVDHH_12515 [Staphylococcus saprophyticus]